MLEKMKVRYVKLVDKAKVPTYGSAHAAGADLYACLEEGERTVAPGRTEFIHTGVAVEIPPGLVGLVYARSGLACKQGLAPANKVGVVDSDYRGEIIVALHNHSERDVVVGDGERIAQMVITPYIEAAFEEVGELTGTTRGVGGFGSTGRGVE